MTDNKSHDERLAELFNEFHAFRDDRERKFRLVWILLCISMGCSSAAMIGIWLLR